MNSKYVELSTNQIVSAKKRLRHELLFLLQVVDPKTKQEYENENINVVSALDSILYKIGGLNKLFNEPPELVWLLSHIKEAQVSYKEDGYSEEEFPISSFRKLILDAVNELKNIKEV